MVLKTLSHDYVRSAYTDAMDSRSKLSAMGCGLVSHLQRVVPSAMVNTGKRSGCCFACRRRRVRVFSPI